MLLPTGRSASDVPTNHENHCKNWGFGPIHLATKPGATAIDESLPHSRQLPQGWL
jgi:hypothetical protein